VGQSAGPVEFGDGLISDKPLDELVLGHLAGD